MLRRAGAWGSLRRLRNIIGGGLDKAIADYSTAISLDPGISYLYVNRASSYLQLGEHEKALEDSSQAIDLDPGNAMAFTSRGSPYGELGELEKAIGNLSQAIELNSDYALA